MAILAAASEQQRAFERSDLKHGVFTYCLLKRLEGEVSANSNGLVSLDELKQFVTKEVRKLTGNMQTPQFKYSTDFRFKVAPAPPGAAD